MSPEEVLDSARDYLSVQARSLLCYWAAEELGTGYQLGGEKGSKIG